MFDVRPTDNKVVSVSRTFDAAHAVVGAGKVTANAVNRVGKGAAALICFYLAGMAIIGALGSMVSAPSSAHMLVSGALGCLIAMAFGYAGYRFMLRAKNG